MTSPHLKLVYHRGAVVTYGDWWRTDVDVGPGADVEVRFAPPFIFVASRVSAWGVRASDVGSVYFVGLTVENRKGKRVDLNAGRDTKLHVPVLAFRRDAFDVQVTFPPAMPGEYIAARLRNEGEALARVHLEVSNTDAEPRERP